MNWRGLAFVCGPIITTATSKSAAAVTRTSGGPQVETEIALWAFRPVGRMPTPVANGQ